MGVSVCDDRARGQGFVNGVGLVPLAIVLGGAFGCFTSSNFDGTRYLCPAPEMSCPTDFQCVSGVCMQDGSLADGGSTTDAAVDAGPQAMARCGLPSDINTSFEVDPFFLLFLGDGTVEYTDGELVLDLVAAPGEYREAQIFSDVETNLKGGRLGVELTSVELGDPLTQTAIRLWSDSHLDELVFYIKDTSLRTAQWNDGSEISVATIPFDPIAHRYVAFREFEGLVSFEVSADKSNWTVINQMATPTWIESTRIRIEVSASDPASSINGRFSEVFGETVTASDVSSCTSADYAESFDDDVVVPLLEPYKENCSVSFSAGQASFDILDDSIAGFCGFFTQTLFDLNDRPASVTLAGPISSRTSTAFFELVAQGGFASFEIYDASTDPETPEPRIKYAICPNDICTAVADEGVNPLERFWRYRADGTSLNWEVSTNGSNWRVAATSSGVLDLSRAIADFGVFNLNKASEIVVIEALHEQD